jgi:hypothetical protein
LRPITPDLPVCQDLPTTAGAETEPTALNIFTSGPNKSPLSNPRMVAPSKAMIASVTPKSQALAKPCAPPSTGVNCNDNEAKAPKGNDMPQKDMPKGCLKHRTSTVKDKAAKNAATPQSMCSKTSGTPS